MASAYSVLHNYDQPTYSPDFEFINAALSYKQQKFDTHKMKLQNMADQFAMLQVARGVDQEYIDNRLNEVIRTTNSAMQGMDLSDDNFFSSLSANVSQVLDENVKGAVLSTKQIQAEDKMMDDLRKNDKDGKYSQLNHQYALAKSDRSRYLGSKELGDKYKGGFNYTEYRDVSKKILDNLPKLADHLKEPIKKFISEGAFRGIDTYEQVDQQKIREAMSIILDQKDLAQLNVNSWGTYGSMSDEQFRSEFESYINPRVQRVEEDIQTLETYLQKNLSKEEKEATQRAIDDKRVYLDEMLVNNDYDNLVQSNGREAIEQKLYKGQFFDTVASTYGYGPRFIKREIDEVHARGVELAEKQRQFDLNYELKVQEYNLKKAKSDAELGLTDGTGNQGRTTTGYGEITPEGEKKSKFEIFEDQTESAYNTMKGLIRNRLGYNLESQDFQELSEAIKLHEIPESGQYTVKLKSGKKVTFDAQADFDTLSSFVKNFVEDSPNKLAFYDGAKSIIKGVQNDLKKMVAGGNTEVYGHIPSFYFRVVDKGQGDFQVESLKDKGYFSYLLQKSAKGKKLTPAEEKSFELYTAYTLASGNESTGSNAEANRKALYAYARDKALRGVKTNGLIPTLDELNPEKRSRTEINFNFKSEKARELYDATAPLLEKSIKSGITDLTRNSGYNTARVIPKGDIGNTIKRVDELYDLRAKRSLTPQETQELKTKIEKLREATQPKVVTSSADLGDLGFLDSRFRSQKGASVSFGDYESRLDTKFKAYNESIEKTLDETMKEKRVEEITLTPESPEYKKLLPLLGSAIEVGANFKQPIVIRRGGENQEQVLIGTVKKGKGGEYKLQGSAFPQEILTKAGVNFGPNEEATYNAKHGEYARNLSLGNNLLSNEQRVLYGSQGLLPLSTNKPETILRVMGVEKDNPISQPFEQLIRDYQNGNIDFKVEAINGTYYHTARSKRNNELITVSSPLGPEIYKSEEREVLRNAIMKNENLLYNYIEQEISNY